MTMDTATQTARRMIGVPEWETDGYGVHTAHVPDCTLWVELAADEGYAAALLWSSDYGDGTDLTEEELGSFDTLRMAKAAAVVAVIAAAAAVVEWERNNIPEDE